MMLQGSLGKRILIYEGSSKLLYKGLDDDSLVLHFIKKEEHDVWRNKISESIWMYLKSIGIENHFIQSLNVREQLIMAVDVYPVFVRLHNIAQEDLFSRLGIEVGTVFPKPLVEWHLKSKFLQDPMISRDHIHYFKWLKQDEVDSIYKLAIKVNDVLRALLFYLGLKPATIELHFGSRDGQILLIDELSPKTISFWDEDRLTTSSLELAYSNMQAVSNQLLKPRNFLA